MKESIRVNQWINERIDQSHVYRLCLYSTDVFKIEGTHRSSLSTTCSFRSRHTSRSLEKRNHSFVFHYGFISSASRDFILRAKYTPQVQEPLMVPEVQEHHSLPSVQPHHLLPWCQADHLHPFKQNGNVDRMTGPRLIWTTRILVTLLTGGPAKPAGPGGPPSPRSPCRRTEETVSQGKLTWGQFILCHHLIFRLQSCDREALKQQNWGETSKTTNSASWAFLSTVWDLRPKTSRSTNTYQKRSWTGRGCCNNTNVV